MGLLQFERATAAAGCDFLSGLCVCVVFVNRQQVKAEGRFMA